VALACLCLVQPVHALDGFAYTRDFEVPAAGWVRVPLDIAALRHMAPGGADLHVFAPGGESIPFRLSATLPESASRPAQVKKQGDRAWVLDTGADPFPHERLVLDLTTPEIAIPALRLESSPDRETWEPLASAVPVRLGGAEGVQRVALTYPSTSHRFLRLLWPTASPALASAAVETVAGPLLTFVIQGAPCRHASSASICTLEIPAGQVLRRLTVEVEGAGRDAGRNAGRKEPGAVGYRLQSAVESRWELLAEGVWEGAGRHVLAGGPKPMPGSTLRLELHGPGGPRAIGYVFELAVPTVLFQAPGPGQYLLAYGGIRGGAVTPGDRPAEALWLEPGPEKPGTPPQLPAGPGASLDRIRFSNGWDISAPDAKPGDLVRLELSSIVYGAAREDLGDLRLSAGGRQIPFFRWSPPDPAFAAGDPGLRPGVSDRPGESRVVVSLPSEGLPLTQIHLSAAAAPLSRPVTVLYVDPDHRSRSGQAAASSTWECSPEPPLPCRARLDLSGTAPRLLTVRLRDGDNPRLSTLGVSVWRRRDVLLFVWPELEKDAAVRLLAGAESLEAPRYDLASLGPALLGHPWQTAEIRRAGADAEKPWWGRWVMPLGVTIAAAWLVWLLRRILSEA
jgi:hypothetical protein